MSSQTVCPCGVDFAEADLEAMTADEVEAHREHATAWLADPDRLVDEALAYVLGALDAIHHVYHDEGLAETIDAASVSELVHASIDSLSGALAETIERRAAIAEAAS
jgi:hypothetical protein